MDSGKKVIIENFAGKPDLIIFDIFNLFNRIKRQNTNSQKLEMYGTIG
ncbi:hypothetical protein K9M16_01815 [Candidatus Babeliales bacterium]|nr:hypothetical protein [Candidatus Babeliales bacterium]